MKKILFVTDFYCKVQGRKYYEEDLHLSGVLKDHFKLIISHPTQAVEFIEDVDFVVFRNTGPIQNYKEEYNHFVNSVLEKGIKTFNSFDGKADMKGKSYMLELMDNDFAIIPTIDNIKNLEKLGDPEKYIVKPLDGADSIGIEILKREELENK